MINDYIMIKNIISEVLDTILKDDSDYINHDRVVHEIGEDLQFIIDAIAEIINHPKFSSNVGTPLSISELFEEASEVISDIYTFDILELKNKCDNVTYIFLHTCALHQILRGSLINNDAYFNLNEEINYVLENILIKYFDDDDKFYHDSDSDYDSSDDLHDHIDNSSEDSDDEFVWVYEK